MPLTTKFHFSVALLKRVFLFHFVLFSFSSTLNVSEYSLIFTVTLVLAFLNILGSVLLTGFVVPLCQCVSPSSFRSKLSSAWFVSCRFSQFFIIIQYLFYEKRSFESEYRVGFLSCAAKAIFCEDVCSDRALCNPPVPNSPFESGAFVSCAASH